MVLLPIFISQPLVNPKTPLTEFSFKNTSSIANVPVVPQDPGSGGGGQGVI
jgi:hypothetical protein